MEGRDTLVECLSSEGEKIKVVSGRVVKKANNVRGYLGRFSTRVWVDGEMVEEFYGRGMDIDLGDVCFIHHKLEELAAGRASSEEIVDCLFNYQASFGERDAKQDSISKGEIVPIDYFKR